jgi:hypothetical protein
VRASLFLLYFLDNGINLVPAAVRVESVVFIFGGLPFSHGQLPVIINIRLKTKNHVGRFLLR